MVSEDGGNSFKLIHILSGDCADRFYANKVTGTFIIRTKLGKLLFGKSGIDIYSGIHN